MVRGVDSVGSSVGEPTSGSRIMPSPTREDFRSSELAVTVFVALALTVGLAGPAAADTTPEVGHIYSGCHMAQSTSECILNIIPYFLSIGSAQMREDLIAS